MFRPKNPPQNTTKIAKKIRYYGIYKYLRLRENISLPSKMKILFNKNQNFNLLIPTFNQKLLL